MAERETLIEVVCRRTRDTVDLAQNPVQNHHPDPDQHQRTVDVVSLAQNHAPGLDLGPGKGGKTTQNHSHLLLTPETRWTVDR